MDKKIKRFAITTIICVLVASIFGTVMVLAAPPDLVFPSLINAFITNTSSNPVPVEISGLLLETKEETIITLIPGETTQDDPFHLIIDTKGYREITMYFFTQDYEIPPHTGCWMDVYFTMGDDLEKGKYFVDGLFSAKPTSEVKIYEIRGSSLDIHVWTNFAVDAMLNLYYYMTA